MNNRGVYGTRRPAIIDVINDVEIYYNYKPNRAFDSTTNQSFMKVENVVDWIIPATTEAGGNILNGMFTLKLPLSVFGNRGYYNIFIKPKEIDTQIVDVSVLAAFPDIKGVVLNADDIGVDSNDLEGYRIEYLNETGNREQTFRIITSSGRAEPVVQNLTNSSQKSTRYRYNESANLLFCTVSPSSATSFKPNVIPFIGYTGQNIRLINTKFDPLCIEIEMVDKDINTLYTLIGGNQARNLDKGLMTTYTSDNEIFNQVEYATLKSSINGKPMYDIKINKDNDVDFGEDWDIITEDL